MFSRRQFLSVAATSAAVVAVSGCKCPFACKPGIRVALQLYSVRDLFKDNPAAVLKQVKEMGYAGVEFAGLAGKSPKEMRAMLDDTGLVACGTHIGLNSIKPENIGKTMEENQILGNPHLIVPGMNANTKEGWVEFAEIFNQAADTAAKNSMFVGYHNHQGEFKDKFDGVCKWEIFCSNIHPNVILQMDVGHVATAGEDPVAWMKKFPKHYRTIHAKEVYPSDGIMGQPPAGKKGVDWDGVIAFAKTDITQWFIVEAEADPKTYKNVKGCIDFFKTKGLA